ncbi:prephenate dehydratase [Adhaeretor mobilis]|uniref:prephenate dehydratase n=1 Tax=Adhaeretor mobilis TaxID=1930276 RepID=A0A517MVI9_9BACT|nr:prephenate dehydratase [Adhaeretor mobilis]QDS98892.1 P-protein [Adhaeretor mobilis]
MPKKKSSSIERVPTPKHLAKLDREILALLNERVEKAIARKAAKPEESDTLKDAREAIETLVAESKGPLGGEAVQAVFRELYSGQRAAAQKTRVAFLGPDFTFSHLAAIKHFGQSVEFVPVSSIAAVFESVERGTAEYGLVPLENSTDGRVTDALDGLSKSTAKICGEVPLPIRHCLLGIGARGDIRRVCSKPQALSQCRNWLSKHLPEAEVTPVASTAEAARMAGADRTIAAVASAEAAAVHELKVIARSIQDQADNVTRFAVIGVSPGEKTGNDKTALVFEAPHEPGALADVMAIFKKQRLNLTWIESFPIPGARGRYLFFLEFQGHPSELRPRRALASLEKKSLRLTVLGSYAQAELID